MNVLVVDDSATVRVFLKSILNSLNHVVFEARNGEEAIEMYKKNNIDLISMDIEMPGMNGYLVSKIIREYESVNNKEKNVPIEI